MIGKVPLGTSGLSISRLCFGLAPLGDMPDTYGYGVTPEGARETVRAIFDSEVNFLDTSRIYGMGRSEARVGEVIAERGGLPKGFVISTKLDRDFETGKFDASRARRSLEESLRAFPTGAEQEALAREAPVSADLVIGVPDSALAAALGFSRASGIPYGEGLIKNR
jgi:aryl-alcohol dehydrogenase-like predicted oxidoreductase